jgi:Protein of unknown function (DUF2924)
MTNPMNRIWCRQPVIPVWGCHLRQALRLHQLCLSCCFLAHIESLRTLKAKELQTRYRDLFGEPSPSSNRAHLFRRIAWRLQAKAEGDLSERARQRASELADDADVRLRAPRQFWREIDARREPANRDPRLPPAGSILEHFYRGQPIRVTVTASDFEYQGKHYGSLSAIAHRVTGTRWNGFHFFGLKQAWKHE